MPKFLEDKLKKEYGNNPSAIYGTMNKIGAMRGNKETAKGAEMERKHNKDMKAKKYKRGGLVHEDEVQDKKLINKAIKKEDKKVQKELKREEKREKKKK